ncbi:MAG TPA: ABC transporter substrate-binding protein, partial [Acidimicrobiales bacterium]|nr:ABC transporter substrate-binding protein [Acidimicrobiales bacterium]
MTSAHWARRFTVIGTAIAVSTMTATGTITGTATAAPSRAADAAASVVNISDEYGVTWNCQFNPFNASDEFDSFGPVYEELVFVDNLKNGSATPWLATSWAWSNGNKTLSFTIRKGVSWSDGQPFSAQDVLFTFDLLKKFPSLDLNADWSVLSKVALAGSDQVVFTFKTAAVPYFYYIADQTPIVPEHLWSSIKDPVTFLDPHPVGTGGYLMSSCSGANIQYTKNDHYWQPGLPHIQTVNFPSYLSNNAANADLKDGTDQWGSQFIPNIQRFYISASPKYYHYWFEPLFNVSIYPNLTNPLLANLAVREAISYAINRAQVSRIGEYGYEPASNQTGIVLPTFTGWYDSSAAAKYGNAYAYNPQKAISILEAAGFKRGSNGIFAKDGKELSFNIVNNGGFSDWVAAVNVVQANLKAVGIQVTPDNLSDTTFLSDVDEGHFDLAYNWDVGGPGPYYEMRQWLYSPNSAAIGQSAASDWERYSSSATDALINQYAATTSVAVQHSIV